MHVRFNNCPSQPNREKEGACAAASPPPEFVVSSTPADGTEEIYNYVVDPTTAQLQPEFLRPRTTPLRKGTGTVRGRKETDGDPFTEPDSALKKQTLLRKKLEKEPEGFRQDNVQLYLLFLNGLVSQWVVNPMITSSDIIGGQQQIF